MSRTKEKQLRNHKSLCSSKTMFAKYTPTNGVSGRLAAWVVDEKEKAKANVKFDSGFVLTYLLKVRQLCFEV